MRILNVDNDPYLTFAETERRQGKKQFSPWTTSNPQWLEMAKRYFPEIPLPTAAQLEKPDLRPVDIRDLQTLPPHTAVMGEACLVAVGGPPAAAVALEHALQGKPVLYASDQEKTLPGKCTRPIWAGAGNHGEPDAFTEAPAYVTGHRPLSFIFKELLRACLPCHYDSQVLDPDYPWLRINFGEWLGNPHQWPAAFRVAWGNQRLAQLYRRARQEGLWPAVLERMRARTQASADYLHSLDKVLGGLLREPRGSLLIAESPQQVRALEDAAAFLKEEGRVLRALTPDQAFEKYGLRPRQALALWEKTHDFIFEADFLKKMTTALQKHGGEIQNAWRLKRIYVDGNPQKGGVLEFCENGATGETRHYRRFSQAHLSLGATSFQPQQYDLISVTGISMNALLIGGALRGGPVVCGPSNHLVPLLAPQTLPVPDRSGQQHSLPVTFVRLSAAGSVSPRDRGQQWYCYDGRQAVHLLHRIRETLPAEMRLVVLSVTGCNRVIGKDGQQVELHPTLYPAGRKKTYSQVTIQIGAGGGGLTQMGFIPATMRAMIHETETKC